MREHLGIMLEPARQDPLPLPDGVWPWEPWPPKLAEQRFLDALRRLADRDSGE